MIQRTFCNVKRTLPRDKAGRLGDFWYLDNVFVKIQGKQQYLWRAVDQDGDTIDILVHMRLLVGKLVAFSDNSTIPLIFIKASCARRTLQPAATRSRETALYLHRLS